MINESYLSIVITGLISALIWFVWQRKQRMSILERNGIPGPKPHLIFGNMFEYYRRGYNDCYDEWLPKYGKIFGYYLGAKPFLVVTDPDLLRRIQVKDFQYFSSRPYVIPGGIYHNKNYHQMLTRSESVRWKQMRSLFSPWFSSSSLRAQTPVVNKCVDILMNKIKSFADKGQEFNIYERLEATTIDLVDSAAFSVSTDIHDTDPNENPFFQASRGVFSIRPKDNILASLLLCFPEFATVINAVRDVCETVWDYFELTYHGLLWKAGHTIVERRLAANNKGKSDNNNNNKQLSNKRKDMLDLMLETRVDPKLSGGKPLTDTELIANVVVIHEAAYESPANWLGFIVHCLVNHADAQQQCYDEICEHFDKYGKFDYNVMSSLPMIDAVINESLRLYPTDTIFTSRQSNADYKYKSMTLPKGIDIRVPTVQLQRDPTYWSEPNQFIPNRFLDKQSPIDPVIYQPFGYGPRVCPGRRFALLSVKVLLCELLHRYAITPGPRTEIGEIERDFKLITCSPKNGVYVQLVPRKKFYPVQIMFALSNKLSWSTMSEITANIHKEKQKYFDEMTFSEQYEHRECDRIVISYPRSGSHFVSYIIQLLLSNCKNTDAFVGYDHLIETTGQRALDKGRSFLDNGAINECCLHSEEANDSTKEEKEDDKEVVFFKTHLRRKLFALNSRAKYLFVVRNPKDTFVSKYMMFRNRHWFGPNEVTPGDYFLMERLIPDREYGDYFHFVADYWPHRSDPNFEVLVFEEVLADPRKGIEQIARFLGKKYFDRLSHMVTDSSDNINNNQKETLLDKIVRLSSFDVMSEKYADNQEIKWRLRKGTAGNWRLHLNNDEAGVVDKLVRKYWTGTGITDLWAPDVI
ncbi:cytochrome P450 3A24-like [Oppia nitens]|uniref:cytochrome P450 3A24-like n=1 Tax=Oppia nitens TaxID=1686743 RepID=UPI0023DA3A5B|nr:cytochrome P450 3A24-like [Oppia nitens]